MSPLSEFLILITGFMAGLRLWLGTYDVIVARRMVRIERRRKVFKALGSFGTALAFGTLSYAIATPNAEARGGLLIIFVLGAFLTLAGAVGELSVYEWREGSSDYLDETTVKGAIRESKEEFHRLEQTADIEERREGEVK